MYSCMGFLSRNAYNNDDDAVLSVSREQREDFWADIRRIEPRGKKSIVLADTHSVRPGRSSCDDPKVSFEHFVVVVV